MLKRFKNLDHVGVEPSSNVANVCRYKEKCNVLNEFFSKLTVKKITKNYNRKVDVFYSANVLCHIEDIKSVFLNIYNSISEKGIFVFEDPYMGDVIKKNSYDQIYDEHVYLFSLASISKLAEQFNLKLFDAAAQNTHGGSMRYFLCKDNTYSETKRLKKLILKEKKLQLDKLSTYKKFAERVYNSKKNLLKLLKKIRDNHKTICAYGATSKSTTIFNFAKLVRTLFKIITITQR